MTTVAKLYPTNLDTIVFGTSYLSSAVTGFYLPVDSIVFNEEARREILYSETRYGGKAINSKDNLTPLTFTCIVFGSSRDQMLERSEQLAMAVGNIKGGLFEYQANDATTTTFYTYEASAKPKLSSQKLNTWHDIQREHSIFAMIFEVTLVTQPFGHSQVFAGISPSRSTLDAVGSYNYFDLLDIKGDIPALVQVKLTNPNAASLNRFYICSRSSIFSTLSTLVSTFEAESAGTVIGTWSTQVDATRSGGNYRRLTGSASVWGSLLFSLPSISQYEGLITVLPVIRSSVTTVVCRCAIYLGGTLLWASSDQFSPEVVNKWHIIYAGEFNFPPIVMSEDVNATLQLAVEFLGTGTVEVDFVQVMYSDEAIQQVDITLDGTYGVTNGQSLLLETDLTNLRKAIVIDSGDNVQRFAKSIYGTLSILATKDTRMYVMFQRLTGTDLHVIADDVTVETNIIYRTTYPFRD